MHPPGLEIIQPEKLQVNLVISENLINQVVAGQIANGIQQYREASACIPNTAECHLPPVGFRPESGAPGGFSERNEASGWNVKTYRDAEGRIIEKDMTDSTGHQIDTSYKYDAQTGRMTEMDTSNKNHDGTFSQNHVEKFDPVTGQRLSNVVTADRIDENGKETRNEADFDPFTNKIRHTEMIGPNGTTEREYNPLTGIIESSEFTAADGSRRVDDKFDSRGRRTNETEYDADGEEKEIVFDPESQRQLYVSR